MIATASSVSSSDGEVGDFARRKRVDQVLADVIVHLREDVGVEQVADRVGERGAVLLRGQLEQVGDVGGVERLDQRARAFGVAGLDRVEDGADELGLEPVVAVQLGLGVSMLGKLDLGHARLPCCGAAGPSPARRHLPARTAVSYVPRPSFPGDTKWPIPRAR